MEIEEILTSNVVDLSSIKGFFANDKDMLIQLINVYLSDTKPRVETLGNSLDTVNYEDVRSIWSFFKIFFWINGYKLFRRSSKSRITSKTK